MSLEAKVHFKDTWIDLTTNTVLNNEFSTQTLSADTVEELTKEVKQLISSRVGSDVYNAQRHITELLGVDGIEYQMQYKMSKEEMFDFILTNNVEITRDGAVWTKTDGRKVRVKYSVKINDLNLAGYDLEEAIQYYHDTRGSR